MCAHAHALAALSVFFRPWRISSVFFKQSGAGYWLIRGIIGIIGDLGFVEGPRW